jgi:hypothetical protein
MNAAAMDRESDGWDVPDGLGPDEFIYEDVVYRLGSVEHLRLTGLVSLASASREVAITGQAGRSRMGATPILGTSGTMIRKPR